MGELNFIQLAIEGKRQALSLNHNCAYVPTDWNELDEYDECELIECYLDEVWRGQADRHRWYTNYPTVLAANYKGEIRYFKWYDIDVHGDGNADDCGYDWPTTEKLLANEVYPKEVKTIIYTKNKEEN